MHIVIYCPVLSSITFSPADLFNMDKAKESSFETWKKNVKYKYILMMLILWLLIVI